LIDHLIFWIGRTQHTHNTHSTHRTYAHLEGVFVEGDVVQPDPPPRLPWAKMKGKLKSPKKEPQLWCVVTSTMLLALTKKPQANMSMP
jgi:hypothetical protein